MKTATVTIRHSDHAEVEELFAALLRGIQTRPNQLFVRPIGYAEAGGVLPTFTYQFEVDFLQSDGEIKFLDGVAPPGPSLDFNAFVATLGNCAAGRLLRRCVEAKRLDLAEVFVQRTLKEVDETSPWSAQVAECLDVQAPVAADGPTLTAPKQL